MLNLNLLQKDWSLDKIEWAMLPGERPREAGCNARLGVHGKFPAVRIAKVEIGGITGFGISRISKEAASELVGASAADIFEPSGAVAPKFRALEFPLLDWLGKVAGKPVYRLFASDEAAVAGGLKVNCYDTTLYFDDLHISNEAEAVQFIKREAQEGFERGQRNFKIKVGRGARWMDMREGMSRDIAIINAVREVAGPAGHIMIDANNGYNLNLTKEVLLATAESRLYWIEEVFHEDNVLYEDLREWMNKNGLSVKIADGEGQADPRLMDWAKAGIVDVVQYDIIHPGFSAWLEIGAKLDKWGKASAPHSYGNIFGNFAGGHLAAAIQGFQFVEWDPADVQGLDSSAYQVKEGTIQIPELPGFGLHFDESYHKQRSADNGWSVSR
jgi:L-rhamnonate dehydratase